MKYILLLSCAFLLVSCSTKTQETSPQEPAPVAPVVSTQSPWLMNEAWSVSYTETLKNLSSKTKDTPEFNACLQTNINMCVQSSIMQIAQKNKSPEFCDELSSNEQKESCKFAVIMGMIQSNWTIELCDSLSWTFKNTCTNQTYKMKALEAKDIKLCEKIPTAESNSWNIMMGPAMGNDRGQCMMNILLADPELKAKDCKILKDEMLEKMCEQSMKQRISLPTTPSVVPPIVPSNTGSTVSSERR
jgi:hypothetical protein